MLLVGVQSNKNFVLDELDFPVVSNAASRIYKPLYYRGELLPGQDLGQSNAVQIVDGKPAHVGTYHPTLYINSLATFIRAFGYSEITVRLFGIICTLATALLLILILRQLIQRNPIAETVFLGVFLLNPYTIANTTIPDIDNTVLPVTLFLFIYSALKLISKNKNFSKKSVLVLGGLFALALWSKLTTPLIIPPLLLCLTYIATKRYKESVVFTLKVSLFGIGAFVLSYFIYCKILSLSPTYTYTFLLESFTKGTSADGPLVGAIKNLANFKQFIFWPTVPIVGIYGVSLISVLTDKKDDDQTKIKKILTVTGLLVTLFYIALISPFGGFFKYPFPVFGLVVMTIVFFYEKHLSNTKPKWIFTLTALVSGFVVEMTIWGDTMYKNLKPFRGLIILILAIVMVHAALKMSKHRNIPIMLSLFIVFSIGFQLSISRTQAISPYSTKYLYGQNGINDATAYLRTVTRNSEVIWSMKDVGYYTHDKYIESYGYYFDTKLEENLIELLQQKKVRYYVATTGIGQDNLDYYAQIRVILDQYAVREKQFGNFVIYKVKD